MLRTFSKHFEMILKLFKTLAELEPATGCLPSRTITVPGLNPRPGGEEALSMIIILSEKKYL